MPKHPDVTVQLSGSDGNAFAIIAKTQRALRNAGYLSKDIDTYFAEATAGDYDHLLRTTMEWVNVE